MATSAIDPFRAGKFTVHLGTSLEGNASPQNRARNVVTFNHKPAQPNAKRKTTLQQVSHRSDSWNLTLQDADERGGEKYTYEGHRMAMTSMYTLTFNQEQHTFVLDEVNSEFSMNLRSAPDEQDKSTLRQRYGEILPGSSMHGGHDNLDSDADNDMFNDDGDGPDPDPDNPFDYRHFLNESKGAHPASDSPMVPGTPNSQAVTPNEPGLGSRDVGSFGSKKATPTKQLSEPATAKRSSDLPRAKASPKPAPATLRRDGNTKKQPKQPKQQRKQGTRGSKEAEMEVEEFVIETRPTSNHSNSSNDDQRGEAVNNDREMEDGDENEGDENVESFGGLLIEMDPESRPKKRKHNFLGTPSGGGPISLHSATMSPAPAFVASPPAIERTASLEGQQPQRRGRDQYSSNGAIEADEDEDDEDEDEMEDVLGHGHGHGHGRVQEQAQQQQQQQQKQKQTQKRGQDRDVERFHLPSPAVRGANTGAGSGGGGGGGGSGRPRARRESTWDADDAADFEAELEQAFEEDGEQDGVLQERNDPDVDLDVDVDMDQDELAPSPLPAPPAPLRTTAAAAAAAAGARRYNAAPVVPAGDESEESEEE